MNLSKLQSSIKEIWIKAEIPVLGKIQVLWHRTKAEAAFTMQYFHQILVHTKTLNPQKMKI